MSGVSTVIGLGVLLTFKSASLSILDQVSQKLKASGTASDELHASMKKLKTMAGIGAGLFGFGASLAFGLVKAAEGSGQLDKSLSELTTIITPLDRDKIPGLRKELMKLSTETGQMPEVLSASMYEAVSSGIDSVASALSFVRVASKGAIGGLTSTETATKTLLAVMNAYGVKLNDVNAATAAATDISDAMFVAIKLGVTRYEEIAASIGATIPLASKLKVGYDELLAAMATITLSGISTSMAFTEIESIFSAVIKGGKQSQVMAQALGIDFTAAGLKSKGFKVWVDELRLALKGLSDQSGQAALKQNLVNAAYDKQRDKVKKSKEEILAYLEKTDPLFKQLTGKSAPEEAVLATLFGRKEAIIGALALMSEEGTKFDRVMNAMKERAGATDSAFEIMSAGFGFAVGQIKMVMNVFQKMIGGAVKEYLTPFVKKIRDLALAFSEWLTVNPEIIKTGVAIIGVISIVSMGAGVVLMLAAAIGGIILALPVLASGFVAIGAIMSSVFLPLLEWGALIYGIYHIWKNNLGGIQDIVGNATDRIKTILQGAWNAMKPAFAEMGAAFKLIGTTILQIFGAQTTDSASILTTIIRGVADAIVAVVKLLATVATWLISNLAPIMTLFAQWIKDMAPDIQRVVGVIIDGFSLAVSGIVGIVRNLWGALAALFTGNFDDIGSHLVAVVDYVIKFFSGITVLLSPIIDGFKMMFQIAIDWVCVQFAKIPEVISSIWESIKAFFATSAESLATSGSNLWEGLKQAINSWILDPLRNWTFEIAGVSIQPFKDFIPALAKGALVTEPTLAMIGERTPEAVIPLENREVVNTVEKMFMGQAPQSNGSRTVNQTYNNRGVGTVVTQVVLDSRVIDTAMTKRRNLSFTNRGHALPRTIAGIA